VPGYEAAQLGHRLELPIEQLIAVAGWRGEVKEFVVDAAALDGGEAIGDQLVSRTRATL
jgi:hypothetical protein